MCIKFTKLLAVLLLEALLSMPKDDEYKYKELNLESTEKYMQL